MREALEGRPARERTRRDYNRVLDAFRSVYRSDPRGAHADASVIATAEVLAAEGRLFEDRRISLDAIEQYELLRRQYPASRSRPGALLTEGEIYKRDLDDATAARSIFTQFLREYPHHALAGGARQELAAIRAELAHGSTSTARSAPSAVAAGKRPGQLQAPSPPEGTGPGLRAGTGSATEHRIGPGNPSAHEMARSGHHNAVLEAALASQATKPAAPDRSMAKPATSQQAQDRPPTTSSFPGARQTPAPGAGGSDAVNSAATAPERPARSGTLVERDLPASDAASLPPTGSSQPAQSTTQPGHNASRNASHNASQTAPDWQAVPVRRISPPLPSGSPASSAAPAALAASGSPASAPADPGRDSGSYGTLTEAALSAPPPPPRRGRLPLVTGVRHWSTSVYTRVAIDLGDEVKYEASRAPNPDRIFFDLHGARLSPELIGKAVVVTDGGYLKRIRAAQFSDDVVRVVLDVSDVSDYSAFFLPNPSRLIIDIHGKAPGAALFAASSPVPVPPPPARSTSAPTPTSRQPNSVAHASATPTARPAISPARQEGLSSLSGTQPRTQPRTQPGTQVIADAGQADPDEAAAADPASRPAHRRRSAGSADSLGDIATLDRQPNTVRATRSPTTAPVSASVADTTPAPQPGSVLAPAPDLTTRHAHSPASEAKAARAHGITPADTPTPAIHASETRVAAPTATGERSMVRALGLKIGRIVVDAGHGGHDSGTLGPGGIEEKEVVLDVALRLGRLLKQRLGADVIYTRDDDTFIPLETRTAIANKAQADLFLSVHANSSSDPSARGVETYYLNFTSSADALEVAARENAVSDQSIHQLSDLVKKITLQDKISESREFAGDVEQSLYSGLESGNPGLKDRGVKKAPFVVLIGANMPSILAEISFLTNPDDAHQLRDPEYRQRIAESIYRGVAKYIGSLSGVRLAESSARPSGQ